MMRSSAPPVHSSKTLKVTVTYLNLSTLVEPAPTIPSQISNLTLLRTKTLPFLFIVIFTTRSVNLGCGMNDAGCPTQISMPSLQTMRLQFMCSTSKAHQPDMSNWTTVSPARSRSHILDYCRNISAVSLVPGSCIGQYVKPNHKAQTGSGSIRVRSITQLR